MKTKIFILLLLCGCSNSSGPPELTPITTTGANTMSFEINGNVFIPSGGGFFGPPAFEVDVKHGSNTNYWDCSIDANSSSQVQVLSILFEKLLDTGTFTLGYTSDLPRSWAEYFANDGSSYFTSDSLPSWIHISRFDTVADVLSGTFAMSVIGGPSRDSVIQITDGRFDFHYTF